MSSDRVMQWRLIIKEYGPNILYIPGSEIKVADALSRLPIVDQHTNVKQIHVRQLANIKKHLP